MPCCELPHSTLSQRRRRGGSERDRCCCRCPLRTKRGLLDSSGFARWRPFAAAPSFAAMVFLVAENASADMICTIHAGPMLSGMVPMSLFSCRSLAEIDGRRRGKRPPGISRRAGVSLEWEFTPPARLMPRPLSAHQSSRYRSTSTRLGVGAVATSSARKVCIHIGPPSCAKHPPSPIWPAASTT